MMPRKDSSNIETAKLALVGVLNRIGEATSLAFALGCSAIKELTSGPRRA